MSLWYNAVMDQAAILAKLSGKTRLLQTLLLSDLIWKISHQEKRRLARQRNGGRKRIRSYEFSGTA